MLDPEQYPECTSIRRDAKGRPCLSNSPGHNTHMMAAMRQHRDTARVPAKVWLIGGIGFKVTTEKGKPGEKGELWRCHNSRGLRTALAAAAANPSAVKLVRGTTFITVDIGDRTLWFYMTREKQTPCIFQL